MKDSWFTLMISWLQVKLQNCILLMKKKKLLTQSEVKSNPRVRSTLEIILTAGIGTLIRLNKNSTCQFVSHQSVNL